MTATVRIPAGARWRGLPVGAVIQFVAPCPACGQDCEWIEERDDTRLLTGLDCPCAG